MLPPAHKVDEAALHRPPDDKFSELAQRVRHRDCFTAVWRITESAFSSFVVEQILLPDEGEILSAVTSIRSLLSNERDPPYRACIEVGSSLRGAV